MFATDDACARIDAAGAREGNDVWIGGVIKTRMIRQINRETFIGGNQNGLKCNKRLQYIVPMPALNGTFRKHFSTPP